MTQKYLYEQLGRLAGLHFFPQDPTELVKAVEESFPEDVMLSAWVQRWLENNANAPTPADIYAERPEKPRKDLQEWNGFHEAKCKECDDTGFKTTMIHHTLQSGDVVYAQGVTRCNCRKKC